MRRLAVVTWLTVGASACFNPDLGDQPFHCGPSGDCPSGYGCVNTLCTRNGAGDGGTRGDAPTVCTPGCNGDTLTTCSAGQAMMTNCAVGCDASASGGPACWSLTPSNVGSALCDTPNATPLRILLARTIGADSCAAEGGTLGSQAGGPPVCVFVYSDITVDAQATLTVTGVGVVPIFVATGTVTIRGTLDVSATGVKGGAGADPKNALGRGGVGAQNSGSGGGGGRPCIDICPVGQGDSGGGGGGAVQIVACQALVLGAGAVINADGGG